MKIHIILKCGPGCYLKTVNEVFFFEAVLFKNEELGL